MTKKRREAVGGEHVVEAAPGLAGGDPEQRRRARPQPLERREGAGVERGVRLGAAGGALRDEAVAIMVREAQGVGRGQVRGERGHRLVERQADDTEHRFARRHRLAERGEGGGHGVEDDVLAVDEGAVDVEDDETWSAHGSVRGA